MMTYATRDQLFTHIDGNGGELSRISNRINGASEDGDKIQQALEFATAEMNEYLAKRYALPITACGVDGFGNTIYPVGLVEICCDMARYDLYEDVAPDNTVVSRKDEAIERLKRIAKGEAILFCSNGDVVPVANSAFVAAVEQRAEFNCFIKPCGC